MVAMNRQSGGMKRRASPSGDELVGRVKEGATELARAVKAGTRSATSQVTQAAGKMTRSLSETAKTEAERLFEQQRKRAVSKVTGAGKVAHQTAHAMRVAKADQLAVYADEAARRIDQAADYLESRTWAKLLEDAEELMRRHEALAVGALFVAGFALARFARAGQAHQEREQDSAAANDERRGRAGRGSRKRRRSKE